jgi:hypothetical protein
LEFKDKEEERLFFRTLGTESFYHFVKTFGTPVNQGADISPVVHRQLCEFSQDPKLLRKGIAMGRNLRKTTVFNRWKAIWCYLKNHEERILIGAETKDIADKTLIWIKEMCQRNAMLVWCFPELSIMDRAYQYRHRFSNTEVEFPREGIYAEPTFQSIGVGGAAQARHFSRIFLTDICGQKAMESDAVMEKTVNWIDNIQELLVEPSLTSPNASEIQLDFTHWKVGDAYEYLQDKYSEYQWRIVPALKMSDDNAAIASRGHRNIVYLNHKDQDIGETNYPDIVDPKSGGQLFPTSYYKDMIANPEKERIFWVQHQNAPHFAEAGANSFRHEWLRFFRWDNRIENDRIVPYIICANDKEEFRKSDIPLYGIIDPGGFSEQGFKGSRCAAIICGQPRKTNKKFCVWTWCRRVLRPSDLMKVLFEAEENYHPRAWRIETIAAQDYIFKDIREEFEKAKKHMVIVPLEKEVSEAAKDRRIEGLINPIGNGEYYFHESMKDILSEIISYPGITKDLIDCLAWYNKMYGKGIIKSPAESINAKRYSDWMRARGIA